jgi:hypothetical protein
LDFNIQRSKTPSTAISIQFDLKFGSLAFKPLGMCSLPLNQSELGVDRARPTVQSLSIMERISSQTRLPTIKTTRAKVKNSPLPRFASLWPVAHLRVMNLPVVSAYRALKKPRSATLPKNDNELA